MVYARRGLLFALCASAVVRSTSLPACAARSYGEPSRHMMPTPFAGGDLEEPGVMEAALKARAPNKELVFLSVGDTRDHRRMNKDPALRTISMDFLLNLLANFKTLGIEHHLILTTKKLCKKVLQAEHCMYNCAWTSLWHERTDDLARWSLKEGDMFLMWAQQWRYIARAVEMGHRVLRTDTDVYFAEDPYPILSGPLFGQYAMVVQQDFGGPLGGRPVCKPSNQGGPGGSCGTHTGTSLLNIGLVYVRSSGSGGAFAVINGTWARFLQKLSGPFAGDVQALIDQPLMRNLADELSVADPGLGKRDRRWMAMSCGAAPIYGGADTCALQERGACAAVAAERAKTAFVVQAVQPPKAAGGALRTTERLALAPDWLFGRGCLTHVRHPAALMRAARGAAAKEASTCTLPPGSGRLAMPAPGPAAGLLVATHFVYSMALKRKRTFRAFAWDAASHNRTTYATGSCWDRAQKGVVFGHTFFAQTEAKSVLCAMPSGQDSECACCAGMPSLKEMQDKGSSSLELETTSGTKIRSKKHMAMLEGCSDYQSFWD